MFLSVAGRSSGGFWSGSAYPSTSGRVEVLSDLRELSVWFTVTVEEEGEGKRLAS